MSLDLQEQIRASRATSEAAAAARLASSAARSSGQQPTSSRSSRSSTSPERVALERSIMHEHALLASSGTEEATVPPSPPTSPRQKIIHSTGNRGVPMTQAELRDAERSTSSSPLRTPTQSADLRLRSSTVTSPSRSSSLSPTLEERKAMLAKIKSDAAALDRNVRQAEEKQYRLSAEFQSISNTLKDQPAPHVPGAFGRSHSVPPRVTPAPTLIDTPRDLDTTELPANKNGRGCVCRCQ
eukprot:TRINITY_DN2624_c0_g1_i2.p1 TRINITY_DN2624_c0_g1~~TRINITY_DN2624_c0_g1_i2.p1  ORF type:complete len:240 (+),score=12.93 TRINITY_DN2624_c0_g1_i2:70-789(+)